MAAKRLHSAPSESDPEKLPGEKRLKTTPSFSTVIREAMMVKTFQTFVCANLEPLLRRVVKEEVEQGIARAARTLNRSPSLQLESSSDQPSTLQLVFVKKLSLPIFTGTKIQDTDNNSLQLRLIDTKNGGHTPVVLPTKVEIVALDGDFPGNDVEGFTSNQFNSNTVKAREGKRPLLAGDVQVTLRDGVVTIDELEFTDNSSWLRSRTFRVGAKVVPGSCQGMKIKEAITEPFPVKDHRGELYKKNYPPSLQDEVWRLERIGKDGAFHKKLSAEGIQNVQQFLKMYHKDEANLRRILGMGMSDRMWDGTIKHAKTCELGNKSYLYKKKSNTAILFNPVCEVMYVCINGEVVPSNSLCGFQKSYVDRMVMEAYENWDTLEELDDINTNAINLTTPLLLNDTLMFPDADLNHEVFTDQAPNFGCIIPSNNMHLDYSGNWMFQPISSSSDDSINQTQHLIYYN